MRSKFDRQPVASFMSRKRRRDYATWSWRLERSAQEEDPADAPIPPFLVTVQGSAVHVVCDTLEQAREQAELLSQQRQRRVLVQEEGAAKPIASVGPPEDNSAGRD